MTTIRLSSEQKEAVRKATEILEKSLGHRLSQGEAVAALNSCYGLQVDPEGTARIAAEYRLVTVPRG